MRRLIRFTIILLFVYVCDARKVHRMQHGQLETISKDNSQIEPLNIYCYGGKPKYLLYIWQSVFLQIDSKSDGYLHYDGSTPEEIEKIYQEQKSSWSFNPFYWKQKSFQLDPFNQSCVGIESRDNYSVYLNVIRIDYWKVLRLVLGIVLYFSADRLSRNTIFYYICGVSLGVGASFLILIYFLSKLFPKRPVMYGVALCGWTVGVYIIQLLWDNVQTILMHYQSYVVWYIFITGFISFILCYRWGPVTNQRTKNLIRWTLQIVGLISVFSSSHFQEAAMAQIILILLTYNMPKSWVAKSKTYWKRKFPPKVKFITNDEYYHQGVKETTKALEDLRRYCSSPECNQWKTALKIKDVKSYPSFPPLWQPPKWFASFMEGNSHLSDEEILEYETSIQQTDLTDDEEEISEEEED